MSKILSGIFSILKASWISLLLMGFTLWPTLQFQKSDYHFGWQHPVASVRPHI